MTRAMILALLVSAAGPAFAQSAWTLRESMSPGERAALLFRAEGAPAAIRIDCSAEGTMLRVWTRAPRHALAATNGGPTFVSVFVGRREFRYGANLAQRDNGDWVVEAPVQNPAEFLPAVRAVPRIAIVTHAGRELAPTPAGDFLDRFDRACRP